MTRTLRHLPTFVALVALGSSGLAGAQGPSVDVFSVVVGTDVGGPGQERLRFAETDAGRVRDSLVAVGGTPAANVTVLRRPRVAELERALATTRAAVAEARRRGRATQLVFYYSGHARSQSLNLGSEELRLSRLRDLIASVGADLTLVLFDACQSGAITRARGVESAESFSVNSAAELRTRGIAFMASSTRDELSQESDALQGGVFTHHLVAGLRGAADADHDGAVTLDEVYRYAYHRTLSETTRSAIGGQHVSLETDLVGQGGVVLAHPGRTTVALLLPTGLEGTVLVEHARSGSVVAEVTKASADAVRLALVAGRFRVIVRGRRSLHECSLTLRSGQTSTLDLGACTERDPSRDVRSRGRPERAPWGFELGMGLISIRNDAYLDTLDSFGFSRAYPVAVASRGTFVVERRLPRVFSLVLRAQTFDHPTYSRDRNVGSMAVSPVDSFAYTAFGLAAGARATGLYAGGRLGVYGELAAGLGIAVTRFRSGDEPTDRQTEVGYTLGGLAGIRYMPALRFGIYAELGYTFAPIARNLFEQTHDSGGLAGTVGLRMEMHP